MKQDSCIFTILFDYVNFQEFLNCTETEKYQNNYLKTIHVW